VLVPVSVAVAVSVCCVEHLQALVNHMENELERKREAFEESARKINEANQESMRDVMESFASKVAVHLNVIQSEEGGGGGGGASAELMADIAKQIDSVKKDMAVKNEGLVEMLQELDTTLKINSKRMSRSSMGSRGGDGLGIGDAVRNGSHPGVSAPLPPEEMDAIKADLHFAVAGAMKNVLDEHKNGVVLLNMPDHNKPAGFMHGDGAGMLHTTMQQNMREQRQLHSQLAGEFCTAGQTNHVCLRLLTRHFSCRRYGAHARAIFKARGKDEHPALVRATIRRRRRCQEGGKIHHQAPVRRAIRKRVASGHREQAPAQPRAGCPVRIGG